MDGGVAQLAALIATDMMSWGDAPPHVELAVYGTDDARAIAEALDEFCGNELAGRVSRGLFHVSSIGCVTGVELADGRRVVIKAHQPDRDLEWLREVVRVQRHLALRGKFATIVCSGPSPLRLGHAIVEMFVDVGTTRDGHEPVVRRALARGLAEIVEGCDELTGSSILRSQSLSEPSEVQLWPTPHSKLFDFAATARGAEWVDDVARAARARFPPADVAVGELVIGHGDWRAEHVRFVGDRPVAAFDWDSLCKEREPALVGYTAHAFCADWTRHDAAGDARIAPAPTLDEARAFVADYEAARGRRFGADERRLAGAAFAYSCAYTARCGWALGRDERTEPGTFAHLVASHGPTLAEL
jgi:hypothetical protein